MVGSSDEESHIDSPQTSNVPHRFVVYSSQVGPIVWAKVEGVYVHETLYLLVSYGI